MNPRLLLSVMEEFVQANGKDPRHAETLEMLGGLDKHLRKTTADGSASPGAKATAAAAIAGAGQAAERAKQEPAKREPEAPAADQPKDFASASAQAKERMAA